MYNQIIKNLFLGSLEEALQFEKEKPDGHIIVVLETRPVNEPFHAIHVPVLTSSGHVHSTQLDKVACIIEALLQLKKPLLVHCGAGIERSPITLAWYLHKYLNMSMDEAYDRITIKRPIVRDHQKDWLVIDEN